MIQRHLAQSHVDCVVQCTISQGCMSVNVCPYPAVGGVVCELNGGVVEDPDYEPICAHYELLIC